MSSRRSTQSHRSGHSSSHRSGGSRHSTTQVSNGFIFVNFPTIRNNGYNYVWPNILLIPLWQTTAQLIASLNTHRVNTLTELCRIERVAAVASEEDQILFQEPMTSAWTHYVTSHQLLNELRGLTRNYPICGELLDDAKWRVSNDPNSNRSWNYAWLCLAKIGDE